MWSVYWASVSRDPARVLQLPKCSSSDQPAGIWRFEIGDAALEIREPRSIARIRVRDVRLELPDLLSV